MGLKSREVTKLYNEKRTGLLYVGVTPQIVRSIQSVLESGTVRSIQHLRQIVRVFIKQSEYGYTHFLNFQWANII